MHKISGEKVLRNKIAIFAFFTDPAPASGGARGLALQPMPTGSMHVWAARRCKLCKRTALLLLKNHT